jgi:hypothetical protein
LRRGKNLRRWKSRKADCGPCAMKQPKTLEEIVRYLAPADEDEVREFAERLLAKGGSEAHREPKFAWAGVLRDLRDRYSAVELQHQIARWRIEGE